MVGSLFHTVACTEKLEGCTPYYSTHTKLHTAQYPYKTPYCKYPHKLYYAAIPVTDLERPWGLQEGGVPRFQNSWYMKVVMLSALCTSCLYPHEILQYLYKIPSGTLCSWISCLCNVYKQHLIKHTICYIIHMNFRYQHCNAQYCYSKSHSMHWTNLWGHKSHNPKGHNVKSPLQWQPQTLHTQSYNVNYS